MEIAIILVAVLGVIGIGYAVWKHIWENVLLRLLGDADYLRNFAETRFAEIDTDGDGIITRWDVYQAQQKLAGALSEKEGRYLKDLDSYIWLIGHVVSRTRTVSPMNGMVVWLENFGVDRKDLSTWPSRVRIEYHKHAGTWD